MNRVKANLLSLLFHLIDVYERGGVGGNMHFEPKDQLRGRRKVFARQSPYGPAFPAGDLTRLQAIVFFPEVLQQEQGGHPKLRGIVKLKDRR